jgi:ketosteroid isomerase-like protein
MASLESVMASTQNGLVCVCFLALAACATPSAGQTRTAPEYVGLLQRLQDDRQSVLAQPGDRDRAELIAADLAFADDALQRGAREAFTARMHPDGLLVSPGEPVAIGVAAINEALANDASEWRWTPLDARVDGDLGVTWGWAVIAWSDAAGERQWVHTRYTTVWRRHQGAWRIWIDIGNAGPPPVAALIPSLQRE